MGGPPLPIFFLPLDTKGSAFPPSKKHYYGSNNLHKTPKPSPRHQYRTASLLLSSLPATSIIAALPLNLDLSARRLLVWAYSQPVNQSKTPEQPPASVQRPASPPPPCFPAGSPPSTVGALRLSLTKHSVGFSIISAVSLSLDSSPSPSTLHPSFPDQPRIPSWSQQQHGPEFSPRQLASPVPRRGKRGPAVFEVPDDAPPILPLPVSVTATHAHHG